MAWLICIKARNCKSQTCTHKKPHKVDLRYKANQWHLYPNPNLHPFDPCRGAYCIKIDNYKKEVER